MLVISNPKIFRMKKIELIISHGSLKDNDVIPFTENVLQNLKGNALFTLTTERLDTVRASSLPGLPNCLGKSTDSAVIISDNLDTFN